MMNLHNKGYIQVDKPKTEKKSKKEPGTFSLTRLLLLIFILYLGSTDSLKNSISSLILGQKGTDKVYEGVTNATEASSKEKPNFIKDIYLNKIDRAEDVTRKSNLNDIRYGLEIYFAENDNYPESITAVRLNDTSSSVYKTLTKYVRPENLKDPKDPEYYYSYKSDGKDFEITARLENTKDPECENDRASICIYKVSSSRK